VILQFYGISENKVHVPQHFLNLLPLPQGQEALRPTPWKGDLGIMLAGISIP